MPGEVGAIGVPDGTAPIRPSLLLPAERFAVAGTLATSWPHVFFHVYPPSGEYA